jgi:hypothetical protein
VSAPAAGSVTEAARIAAAEAAGHRFYVSVRSGTRVGLLAGPFPAHREALGWVDRVQELARRLDPWAGFYLFGTCSSAAPRRVGRLNARLGLPVVV